MAIDGELNLNLQVMEGSKDDAAIDSMDPDQDFLMDALFGSLDGASKGNTGAALPFPNPREMYKGTTTNAGETDDDNGRLVNIIHLLQISSNLV